MNTHYSLLIADDDTDLRELLVEVLKPLGFPVRTAGDGQELLELAYGDPGIVAILSDINMPVIDGLQALAEMRGHGLDLPVVLLSGFADKDRVIEALRLGAMDFLEKPFNSEHLRQVIARALDMGLCMKNVERDLDALILRYGIAPRDAESFRAAQRPLLLMKIGRNVYFKRKAA